MRWVVLVIVLALLSLGGGAVVVDLARRGRRLTDAPGKPGRSPEALAAEASAVVGRPVDATAYTLARMLRSEAGSGNLTHRAAVAHVALNDSRELGWTLLKTLTYHKDGLYLGPQRNGRYATSRDPYEIDLQVAELVLDGALPDPTNGAVKFVHVSAFGVQEGTTSYDDVVVRWGKDGLVPSEVPGAGEDLRVFHRRRAAAGVA